MRMHALDDAIGLASNECPYGPLPSVVRAIESATANINRYPDHRAVELREAIAEHLGIEAANVTVGCGSVGLLAQLALAYVDPGDEVVFGRPSFEAYPIFTQIAGGAPVAVPLRGQSLDLDAIANAVSGRTKLVLLANPTPAQQLAHITVNGASTRPGDLFASGTVSGPEPGTEGSLLEATWGGERPIELPDGTTRAFLLDGDRVVLRGWAGGDTRPRIGLGEVACTVIGDSTGHLTGEG